MFISISWKQSKKLKNLINIDLTLITTQCLCLLDSMRKSKTSQKKKRKKRKITGDINVQIMIFSE